MTQLLFGAAPFILIHPCTTRPDTMQQEWLFLLALASPLAPLGVAVGAGTADGVETTTSTSTTTTISSATPTGRTLATVSEGITIRGATIRSIAAELRTAIGLQQGSMAETPVEIHW